MSSEPLVSVGQGDNARTISEEDISRPSGVPWLPLLCLWLAFGVLAWIWETAGQR